MLISRGFLASPARAGVGTPDRECKDQKSRAAFRATLNTDGSTWMRGRGWALAAGLNAYTSYAAVNSRVAAQTTRQITEALLG